MPKFLGNLDMDNNQILNIIVHRGTSAPATPAEGMLWMDTSAAHVLKFYNGSAWIALNVVIAAETTDTTCSVLIVTDATGNLPIKTNPDFLYNASTGLLTVPGITSRITPRVITTTSGSTLTVPCQSCEIYTVTALAANVTFAEPSGTPFEGQRLIIRIKDNGTARTITWNAIFHEANDLTPPATTVVNETTYVGLIYNGQSSTWDMLAVAQVK